MTPPSTDVHAAHDAAKILPIAATFLLLPPFILIVTAPVTIAGVPLIVVYVFAVWAAITFAAWLIARRIEAPERLGDQIDVEDPSGTDKP